MILGQGIYGVNFCFDVRCLITVCISSGSRILSLGKKLSESLLYQIFSLLPWQKVKLQPKLYFCNNIATLCGIVAVVPLWTIPNCYAMVIEVLSHHSN